MKLLTWLGLLLGMASLAGAGEAPGGSLAVKDYALKELGTLRLAFPGNWRDQLNRRIEMGTLLEEIELHSGGPQDLTLMVTVFHMASTNALTGFDVRASSLAGLKTELASAEEKTPEVRDLNGPEIKAAYVSITDKNISAADPKPGEWKHLTAGYGKLGPVIVGFRIVSNRANEAEKSAALAAVQSARFIQKP